MPKNLVGTHKYLLDTPCLVIDINSLQNNLKAMQEHALQHHIYIRPHCKTHKCTKVARMQIQYGAIGVCATKVSEASKLIESNIGPVLITSPVVTTQKINQLLSLIQLAPSTLVVTDNFENVSALNQAGHSINQKINVLVDIDAGIGRTGIAPTQALALAEAIYKSPWLNLQGIQCYAGNLQHITSFDERKQRSLSVMKMASEIAMELKKNSLPCPILTGSGTGTYDIDYLASEVTEIQPGSYAVMDVEYSAIGSKEDISSFTKFKHAMTMLTTVISNNRKEHVTVDAGTKALYFDPSTKPRIINFPHLNYDWGGFGDEHGKITALEGASLPKNGDVLELIVPHCDPTINLFDKFYITQNDHVTDVWDIDMRGKCL